MVVFLVGWVLTAASPANAHAALIRSEPTANALLPTSPEQIVLHFNEPLDPATTAITLVTVLGDRTNLGDLEYSDGNRSVSAPVSGLDPGSYTVFWSNVSRVDGHGISGSFPFTLLNPDGSLPGGVFVSGGASGTGDPAPEAGPVAIRLLALLGLTALGSAAFLLLAARTPSPGVVLRLVALSSGLLVAAALLELAEIRQTYVGMNLVDILSQTRTGTYWLARLGFGLMVAVLLLVPTRNARLKAVLAAGVGTAYLATFTATSHAAAASGQFWAQAIDLTHALAAIAWIGSVLGLAVAVRLALASASWVGTVRHLSRVATVLVCIILTTGLLSALVQFDTLSKLYTTRYGLALVLKLTLLLVLLGFAAINARTNRGRWDRVDLHRRRLVLVSAGEVLAGIAVFGAAALMTQSVVARSVIDAGSAYDEVRAAGTIDVRLVVAPNVAGFNTFVVQLTTAAGDPISDADVRLKFVLEGAEANAATLPLSPAGDGTFVGAGGYLGISGDWEVSADVLRNDAADATTGFAVSPESPIGTSASRSGWANPAAGLSGRAVLSVVALAVGIVALTVARMGHGTGASKIVLWAGRVGSVTLSTGLTIAGFLMVTSLISGDSSGASVPTEGAISVTDVARTRDAETTTVSMALHNSGRYDRLISVEVPEGSATVTIVGGRVCGEPPFTGQPGLPIDVPPLRTTTLRPDGCRIEITGSVDDAESLRLVLKFEVGSDVVVDLEGVGPLSPDGPVSLYPPETRLNDPVIDPVIAALGAGDGAAIAALVKYQPMMCGLDRHSPPCPEGTVAGTPVDAFPWYRCDVGFLRLDQRSEGEPNLLSTFDSIPYYLYAVARPVPLAWQGAAVGVLIVTPAADSGDVQSIFVAADGRIIGMADSCGAPLARSMFSPQIEFILPPRE